MDLFEALVLSLCISFNLRNITTCLACVTVPGVPPGDDGHGEQVGHAHPERVAHLPDAGGARAFLGREPGRRDLHRARDNTLELVRNLREECPNLGQEALIIYSLATKFCVYLP